MFAKEYYVQLPFLLMNFLFRAIESETQLSNYMETIFNKLKSLAGLSEEGPIMTTENPNMIRFEELLFLRIACEFSKMY